nr:hypothetical protein [Tanacetum cinerariifolium]
MPPKRNGMSAAAIEQLIEQRVTEALAAQGNNKNSRNPHNSDSNNTVRGERTTHHYTYKDFLNCQPLNFKGTKGVVLLAQWFEKMESVFHISNFTVECQVKYATCTLLGSALTWWNTHVRTVGHDSTYVMPWKTLMKMITEAYCPKSEIKKLETEGMLEVFPIVFQGSVMAFKPKILQEAIELARSLMDQKVRAYAVRQADNIRRMDNNPKDDHVQQPPYKRLDKARAYTARSGEKKEYAGTLPMCNKCKYHHTRPCTAKCRNCKRNDHQTKDCRSRDEPI